MWVTERVCGESFTYCEECNNGRYQMLLSKYNENVDNKL